PAGRVGSAESYFFFSSALGPRLVYIRPVGTGPGRTGTIVAERSVVSAERLKPGGSLRQGAERADVLTVSTRFAPVIIQAAGTGDPSSRDPESFQVSAPDGTPLITATLSAGDLRATRDRWRRATWSIALLTFA